MATKSILKRGFKAEAERIVSDYKQKLNIHACAPLCGFKLAKYLNIEIINATDFLKNEDEIKRLSGENCEEYGWSALTMNTKKGNRIIIHNNFHNPARQQSNIMHEIAHIICDHKVKEQNHNFNIPFGMRYYDELQEEEAIYLGATLQLSKPCLFWANKRNMSNSEIANYFNASIEMVTFRMNTTGIAKRNNFKVNANSK